MNTATLISAPLELRSRRPEVPGEEARIGASPLAPTSAALRQFRIQSADSFVVRQLANLLLKQRYGWRGYQSVSLPADQTINRITLTAIEDSVTIGTITVGLDGLEGMNCEDVFAPEIDVLRARGLRVCEFTKLAIEPEKGTRRVLAGLFHVAYVVAHRMRGYDALVMEVNPRHVHYYERMLGARVIGQERMNRSVNAPAVLLSIDFDYIAQRIRESGGKPELAATDRSLYPLAFTADEEAGVIVRLMALQQPVSLAVN